MPRLSHQERSEVATLLRARVRWKDQAIDTTMLAGAAGLDAGSVMDISFQVEGSKRHK